MKSGPDTLSAVEINFADGAMSFIALLVGSLVHVAGFGVLGVALAVLVRSDVGAIIAGVVAIPAFDNVVRLARPEWYRATISSLVNRFSGTLPATIIDPAEVLEFGAYPVFSWSVWLSNVGPFCFYIAAVVIVAGFALSRYDLE